MAKASILNKIFNAGPLLLLYYLCISEIDTNLEKSFGIEPENFLKIINELKSSKKKNMKLTEQMIT